MLLHVETRNLLAQISALRVEDLAVLRATKHGEGHHPKGKGLPLSVLLQQMGPSTEKAQVNTISISI
jgi:hypothetical protein